MPAKPDSARALARSPMAAPLARLETLAVDLYALYGRPKGLRLCIDVPQRAAGDRPVWGPRQDDAPFLLPFASSDLPTLSAHQALAATILEKGIREAWSAVQAHLLSAPGCSGWAPRVGLLVHHTGWDGLRFSLAMGVETMDGHWQTVQRDGPSFLSSLVALDTCLRCVPAPTSGRWWTAPSADRSTPYQAQDIGAATLLAYGFAGTWGSIGRMLTGKIPKEIHPVHQVYPPQAQQDALAATLAGLPKIPTPQP